MSTIQNAIKSVQDYGNQFTKALERHRGFLGDGSGTVYVSDRDGYVYVRHRQAESADITGSMEPEEVLYSRSDIPPIEGYPVVFGRDIDTEDFQVLATDSQQLLGWIFDKYIKDHHEQHEFNEYDTVWIQKQAMLPLLVYPTSPASTIVRVYGGWYQWDTDWHYFETTTSAELSAYVPIVAGQARFLLICIDGDTETLHYELGNTFLEFMPPRDCEDRIPPPPDGKIPLAAIYLVVGETAFDWDIIYDVRLLFSGGGAMSTGSAPRDAAYVTLAYHDTLSAERLLSAGHGIIVTDNGPNDTVVISVNSAADYNWSGDHSFLSGIEFVAATGVNSITIPDGLVSALHVIDTGGTEFLRLDTDNDYFLVDPAGVGIKVGIGIAAPTHDFHVENTGNTTTLKVADGANNFFLQAGASIGDGGSIGARIILDDNGTGGKRWDITTGRLAGGLVVYNSDDALDAIAITAAGRVGIRTLSPQAQCHIDQPSTTATIPVLVLDQADTSEGFINFIGSNRGVIAGATSSLRSVRVELGGVVYRLALYVDA